MRMALLGLGVLSSIGIAGTDNPRIDPEALKRAKVTLENTTLVKTVADQGIRITDAANEVVRAIKVICDRHRYARESIFDSWSDRGWEIGSSDCASYVSHYEAVITLGHRPVLDYKNVSYEFRATSKVGRLQDKCLAEGKSSLGSSVDDMKSDLASLHVGTIHFVVLDNSDGYGTKEPKVKMSVRGDSDQNVLDIYLALTSKKECLVPGNQEIRRFVSDMVAEVAKSK